MVLLYKNTHDKVVGLSTSKSVRNYVYDTSDSNYESVKDDEEVGKFYKNLNLSKIQEELTPKNTETHKNQVISFNFENELSSFDGFLEGLTDEVLEKLSVQGLESLEKLVSGDIEPRVLDLVRWKFHQLQENKDTDRDDVYDFNFALAFVKEFVSREFQAAKEEELGALKQKYEFENKGKKLAEQENSELVEENKKIKDDFAFQEQEYSNELDAQDATINEQQEFLTVSKEEIDKLEKEKGDLEREAAELTRELTKITGKYAENNEEVELSGDIAKQLENVLKGLEEENEGLLREKEELGDDIKILQEDNGQLGLQNKYLREDLENLEAEFENKLNLKDEKFGELKELLNETKEELNQSNIDNNKLEKERDALQNLNEATNLRNTSLQSELNQSDKDKEAARLLARKAVAEAAENKARELNLLKEKEAEATASRARENALSSENSKLGGQLQRVNESLKNEIANKLAGNLVGRVLSGSVSEVQKAAQERTAQEKAAQNVANSMVDNAISDALSEMEFPFPEEKPKVTSDKHFEHGDDYADLQAENARLKKENQDLNLNNLNKSLSDKNNRALQDQISELEKNKLRADNVLGKIESQSALKESQNQAALAQEKSDELVAGFMKKNHDLINRLKDVNLRNFEDGLAQDEKDRANIDAVRTGILSEIDDDSQFALDKVYADLAQALSDLNDEKSEVKTLKTIIDGMRLNAAHDEIVRKGVEKAKGRLKPTMDFPGLGDESNTDGLPNASITVTDADLEAENADLKKSLGGFMKSLLKLKNKLSSLEKGKSLEDENSSQSNDGLFTREDVEKLADTFQRLLDDAKFAKDNTEKDLEGLKEDLNEVKGYLNESEADLDQAEQDLEDSNDRNAGLKSRIDGLNRVDEDNGRLIAENEELQNKLKEMELRLGSLIQEHDEQQGDQDSSKGKGVANELKPNELWNQLGALRAENETLKDSQSRLRKDFEDLHDSHKTLEKTHEQSQTDYEKALAQKTQEIEGLKADNTTLLADLEKAQNDLVKMQEDHLIEIKKWNVSEIKYLAEMARLRDLVDELDGVNNKPRTFSNTGPNPTPNHVKLDNPIEYQGTESDESYLPVDANSSDAKEYTVFNADPKNKGRVYDSNGYVDVSPNDEFEYPEERLDMQNDDPEVDSSYVAVDPDGSNIRRPRFVNKMPVIEEEQEFSFGNPKPKPTIIISEEKAKESQSVKEPIKIDDIKVKVGDERPDGNKGEEPSKKGASSTGTSTGTSTDDVPTAAIPPRYSEKDPVARSGGVKRPKVKATDPAQTDPAQTDAAQTDAKSEENKSLFGGGRGRNYGTFDDQNPVTNESTKFDITITDHSNENTKEDVQTSSPKVDTNTTGTGTPTSATSTSAKTSTQTDNGFLPNNGQIVRYNPPVNGSKNDGSFLIMFDPAFIGSLISLLQNQNNTPRSNTTSSQGPDALAIPSQANFSSWSSVLIGMLIDARDASQSPDSVNNPAGNTGSGPITSSRPVNVEFNPEQLRQFLIILRTLPGRDRTVFVHDDAENSDLHDRISQLERQLKQAQAKVNPTIIITQDEGYSSDVEVDQEGDDVTEFRNPVWSSPSEGAKNDDVKPNLNKGPNSSVPPLPRVGGPYKPNSGLGPYESVFKKSERSPRSVVRDTWRELPKPRENYLGFDDFNVGDEVEDTYDGFDDEPNTNTTGTSTPTSATSTSAQTSTQTDNDLLPNNGQIVRYNPPVNGSKNDGSFLMMSDPAFIGSLISLLQNQNNTPRSNPTSSQGPNALAIPNQANFSSWFSALIGMLIDARNASQSPDSVNNPAGNTGSGPITSSRPVNVEFNPEQLRQFLIILRTLPGRDRTVFVHDPIDLNPDLLAEIEDLKKQLEKAQKENPKNKDSKKKGWRFPVGTRNGVKGGLRRKPLSSKNPVSNASEVSIGNGTDNTPKIITDGPKTRTTGTKTDSTNEENDWGFDDDSNDSVIDDTHYGFDDEDKNNLDNETYGGFGELDLGGGQGDNPKFSLDDEFKKIDETVHGTLDLKPTDFKFEEVLLPIIKRKGSTAAIDPTTTNPATTTNQFSLDDEFEKIDETVHGTLDLKPTDFELEEVLLPKRTSAQANKDPRSLTQVVTGTSGQTSTGPKVEVESTPIPEAASLTSIGLHEAIKNAATSLCGGDRDFGWSYADSAHPDFKRTSAESKIAGEERSVINAILKYETGTDINGKGAPSYMRGKDGKHTYKENRGNCRAVIELAEALELEGNWKESKADVRNTAGQGPDGNKLFGISWNDASLQSKAENAIKAIKGAHPQLGQELKKLAKEEKYQKPSNSVLKANAQIVGGVVQDQLIN